MGACRKLQGFAGCCSRSWWHRREQLGGRIQIRSNVRVVEVAQFFFQGAFHKFSEPAMSRYPFLFLLALFAFSDASLRGSLGNSHREKRGTHEASSSPRQLQGTRTISGIASTIMEDHFDIGAHFMITVVHTDDGETVKVDMNSHEQYIGQPVTWVIRDKSPAEANVTANPAQQTFPERCVCGACSALRKSACIHALVRSRCVAASGAPISSKLAPQPQMQLVWLTIGRTVGIASLALWILMVQTASS